MGWTSPRMLALVPVFSCSWGSQSLGGYSMTLARVLSEQQAKSAEFPPLWGSGDVSSTPVERRSVRLAGGIQHRRNLLKAERLITEC